MGYGKIQDFKASGDEFSYDGIMAQQSGMAELDDMDLPVWLIDSAKALLEHPSFDDALCVQAEAVTAVFESTFALVKVVSEEARYLISIALVAMHFGRESHDPSTGATLTRLQRFATHLGLAGPNRVAAIVALMRHLGYVEQVTARCDRRIKVLELTKCGEAVASKMAVAALKAVQQFSPNVDYENLVHTDKYFIGRFAAESLQLYLDRGRLTRAMPDYNLFGEQNGGREVMFKLWMAIADQGPSDPVMISCPYKELAESLGVSRGHVRRMIEKGEVKGLFRVRASGGQIIEVLPNFIYLHRIFTSLEYAVMLRAAQNAASKEGRPEHLPW